MRILLKTKMLSVMALGVMGAVFVDGQDLRTTGAAQPTLVEILKDDVQRIELTYQGNKIVLEKTGDDWMQLAPLNGTADWARIKSMILNFRKPIAMDVLVDPNPKDDGKAYGLDASNAITVELWKSTGSEPEVSFELGNDAEAGASFVRLNGASDVYRAHVGGRRRFAYVASDWLNQRLLQFDLAEMTSIQVQQQDVGYTLIKDDTWRIQDYDVALDAQKLSMALQSLSVMRIGERIEKELGPPWMTMTFQVAEEQVSLNVAAPIDRMSVVEIRGETMTVPSLPLERFSHGRSFFQDTRVLSIQSRDELDLIRFKTDLQDIIIQQDLSNGFWKVLQPNNIDLEMRDVFFMVNTLAALSSVEPRPLPVDQSPVATVDIRRLAGDVQQLLIYGAVEGGILCVVSGEDTAFLALEEDIERVLNGFGQSSLFQK